MTKSSRSTFLLGGFNRNVILNPVLQTIRTGSSVLPLREANFAFFLGL
jgi:hypothetical protein